MDDRLRLVADVVIGAESAVAFTGAGVSTSSGVPDFRSRDWAEDIDLDDYNVNYLRVNPRGFWRIHMEFHDMMYDDSVHPNVAHDILAGLEREGWLDAIITQNTDGLHQAAGSERVIELHGNGTRTICRRCQQRTAAASAVERAQSGQLPPICEYCGGVLRPDVTLFGEELPDKAVAEAQSLARECDVLLTLGSSLAVEPGASIPKSVASDGTLVIVTDRGTPHDEQAAAAFQIDVTEFLPRLSKLIAERS
jgi:NAD-dependent deacetylase